MLRADLQKPGITVRNPVVCMTDPGAMLGMMRLNFLSAAAAAGRKKKGAGCLPRAARQAPLLAQTQTFRRRIKPKPASPKPSRAMLAGSGTWVTLKVLFICW